MDPFNATKILSYGAIGLGFLLALLSYRLLAKEQDRVEIRPTMIRAIYSFMGFAFLLALLGFVSEIFKIKEIPSPKSSPGDIEVQVPLAPDAAFKCLKFERYATYLNACAVPISIEWCFFVPTFDQPETKVRWKNLNDSCEGGRTHLSGRLNPGAEFALVMDTIPRTVDGKFEAAWKVTRAFKYGKKL